MTGLLGGMTGLVLACTIGFFTFYCCWPMLPKQIVPVSVRLAFAISSTALLLPLLPAGSGKVSTTVLIAFILTGVLTALVAGVAGYSAELVAAWTVGLLQSDPECAQSGRTEGATLRGLVMISVGVTVFGSPAGTGLFEGIFSIYLSVLHSMLSQDIAVAKGVTLITQIGGYALYTAAVIALPLFAVSILVELLSVLYRRYFRLGYAPEGIQVARFLALIAVLSSGYYFLLQQIGQSADVPAGISETYFQS